MLADLAVQASPIKPPDASDAEDSLPEISPPDASEVELPLPSSASVSALSGLSVLADLAVQASPIEASCSVQFSSPPDASLSVLADLALQATPMQGR